MLNRLFTVCVALIMTLGAIAGCKHTSDNENSAQFKKTVPLKLPEIELKKTSNFTLQPVFSYRNDCKYCYEFKLIFTDYISTASVTFDSVTVQENKYSRVLNDMMIIEPAGKEKARVFTFTFEEGKGDFGSGNVINLIIMKDIKVENNITIERGEFNSFQT